MYFRDTRGDSTLVKLPNLAKSSTRLPRSPQSTNVPQEAEECGEVTNNVGHSIAQRWIISWDGISDPQ